jgi:DNA-binding IclR family transcriptional regulator
MDGDVPGQAERGAVDRQAEGLEIIAKIDAVVTALASEGELSVAELVERVGEPVSSTYRLLSNLLETGIVSAGSKRGRYRPGLFLMRIGSEVEDRTDIRERALPALRDLRAETGQTVYLCVRDRLRAVCIERLDGGDVRSMALRLGASLPLTVGGAPTALLAYLPRSEYESVRDASVAAAVSEGGRRDAAEIDRVVETARGNGVAVSDGDVTPGVGAVGAPVFNHRGEIVAAISVSGIRAHILGDDVRERVRDATKRSADDISAALGWQGEIVR